MLKYYVKRELLVDKEEKLAFYHKKTVGFFEESEIQNINYTIDWTNIDRIDHYLPKDIDYSLVNRINKGKELTLEYNLTYTKTYKEWKNKLNLNYYVIFEEKEPTLANLVNNATVNQLIQYLKERGIYNAN